MRRSDDIDLAAFVVLSSALEATLRPGVSPPALSPAGRPALPYKPSPSRVGETWKKIGPGALGESAGASGSLFGDRGVEGRAVETRTFEGVA